MPNGNFGPDAALAQRLNQIEANLRNMMTTPWLLNASTGQTAGQPGLKTDINGLHLFNSSGVENITLSTADGSATFAGNVNINGNLAVPNGSITNAALATPVTPLVSHVDVSNFSLSTGPNAEKVRTTISVPTGFSQAVVTATTTMNAVNSTAASDSMYLSCTINGSAPGWSTQVTVPAGAVGSCAASSSLLLSPVSGTFYVSAKAATGNANWAASTGNQNAINLDVMVMFLR